MPPRISHVRSVEKGRTSDDTPHSGVIHYKFFDYNRIKSKNYFVIYSQFCWASSAVTPHNAAHKRPLI